MDKEKLLVRFVFGVIDVLLIPVAVFLTLLVIICITIDCCKYRMTPKEWCSWFLDDDDIELLNELAKMFWYPIRYGEIYVPVQNKEEP